MGSRCNCADKADDDDRSTAAAGPKGVLAGMRAHGDPGAMGGKPGPDMELRGMAEAELPDSNVRGGSAMVLGDVPPVRDLEDTAELCNLTVKLSRSSAGCTRKQGALQLGQAE